MSETTPYVRTPLRPDLWELVGPALTGALEAGRAFLRDHHYFPRQRLPEYEENELGWSTTVRDRLSAPSDGPLDWAGVFTYKEADSIHIPVTSVPALHDGINRAIKIAQSDSTFAEGIGDMFAAYGYDPERLEAFIRISFLEIVGNILNRAVALEATDPEALYGFYLELEHSRFSPTLRGDAIIPIVLVSFDIEESIEVFDGVWLEPLGAEMQRSRAVHWMGFDISAYVAAAATHALVFRDVEIANPKWLPKRFSRDRDSQVDLTRLDYFLHALTIESDVSTGYAQVLIRPHGWAASWQHDLPPLLDEWTGRRYPEELERARLTRQRTPLSPEEIRRIVKMSQSLASAPNNVRLAARRSWRVTYRDEVEDRIIDSTIGIEAMVGLEKDELVHRMSQRAAVALSHQFPPKNIYKLMKQVYTQRSTIVHGGVPKKSQVRMGEHEFPAFYIATMLLRLLLQAYLLNDNPWTPEDLDSRILERFEVPEAYLAR